MKNTLALAQVGLKAIEAIQAANHAAYAKGQLNTAYEAYKCNNSIYRHIERDSEEWTSMLAATTQEYKSFQEARRMAYNASRRLETAARSCYNLHHEAEFETN